MVFSSARLPNWLNGLLVAAVLWAPLWGLWHGIEHGPRQAFSSSSGLQEAHVPEDHGHAAHADDGHSDPLGHAAKTDLCHILDHLSQAERLTPSNVVGTAPTMATRTPIFRSAFSPGQDLWSPAQARAPPALI